MPKEKEKNWVWIDAFRVDVALGSEFFATLKRGVKGEEDLKVPERKGVTSGGRVFQDSSANC